MKKHLLITLLLCLLAAFSGCATLSDERTKAYPTEDPGLIGAGAELYEQLSPSAAVEWRTYCRACGHTYVFRCADEAIGLTQSELASRFGGWTVKSFSREFAILEREIDGYCPDHFLLFRKGKKLRVYSVSEPELELVPLVDESAAQYSFSKEELEELASGIAFDSLLELDRYTESHRPGGK